MNHTKNRVLLVESKVERGSLRLDELRRHLSRAKKRSPGYHRVLLVVSPDRRDVAALQVSRVRREDHVSLRAVSWLDVHEWASR